VTDFGLGRLLETGLQAGSEGAVVSEFSTASRDELGVFTDGRVRRTG
jgi:hypothetical protein